MDYRKKFGIKPGSKIRLADIDPGHIAAGHSREQAEREIEQDRTRMAALQYLLYAEQKRSLLIVLQALDAGGKDGTVNHVLSAMNPQGCSVVGFKQPSAEESEHDFLWRVHKWAPRSGEVVVFNRSHYEDVLAVRVHDLVPKKVWSARYDQINDFERLLVADNTHIVKFFLHISPDEQLARFKSRLDDPSKNWKISDSDYAERDYWDAYTAAFEDAISKCSTDHAPWFVIPANHKWYRNLIVSRIICETLEGIGMKMPPPTVDLDDIRLRYHRAAEKGKGGKKSR